MPSPTKGGIKVISTLFDFAAVERYTIERKTSKIWVKFGVAAPRPWGQYQNFDPPIALWGHTSKQNYKQKFHRIYTVFVSCDTILPLTFLPKFR